MSEASIVGEIRRSTNADLIIDLLGRFHPHAIEGGWAARFLERQRIASAIRSEEADLDFCLVTLGGDEGAPDCGILAAIPKPHAEPKFAGAGISPMLFGFLFGFAGQAQFDAVMRNVVELARERARQTLVGPFEATINYSCGLLEEEPAFPLGMMMPKTPLAWGQFMSGFGLARAEQLYTYEIDIEKTPFRPIGQRAVGELNLSARPIRLPVTPTDREAIRDVFNSGWQKNWGYVPIDLGYVDMLVREFWPVLWRGLSWLVYLDDRPVGVAIATPDIEELVRDAPGPARFIGRLWRFFVRRRVRAIRIFILGLSSEIQRSAVAASVVEMLIETGKTAARRYGARYLLVGWTLSSNHRINRMIRHWAPEAPRVVHCMWSLQVPAETVQPPELES